MLGSTVADENVDEFALGFGDDALVLLLRDLQNEKSEKATLLTETKKILRRAKLWTENTQKSKNKTKLASSALSSAMGLTGLLVLAPTFPTLPELSSGCKNFIKAFSCDGLDCSMACLM